MDKGRAPTPASKTSILRSIYPEITVTELEEILTKCHGSLKQSCEEITRRLESSSGFSPYQGSIVQLYREYEGECHYCKVPGSKNIAYGMNSDQITVYDFQFLFDRGWARCGKWIYLPANHKLCCPTYTIRLDVQRFQPRRSHRRCTKRLKRYLETGSCTVDGFSECSTPVERRTQSHTMELSKNERATYHAEIAKALRQMFPLEGDIDFTLIQVQPCKKKKEQRDLSSNICLKLASQVKVSPFQLAERLADLLPAAWKATASKPGFVNFDRIVSGENDTDMSEGEESSWTPSDHSFDFPMSWRHSLGEDCNTGKSHSMEVTLEEPVFTEEKYQLYRKYQIVVHQTSESSSELQPDGFQEFLCKTPLIRQEAKSPNDPPCGYGSFHQTYRIDGKLVAIGVIDILPYCLSSIYFIYDPDFSFLSLGVVSALREIQWIKCLIEQAPKTELRYYYLGYYVHSCPKVRYKSSFKPSYLLCPVTLQWVPMEDAEKVLDTKKYGRFAGEQYERQPPAYHTAQLMQWIRSYSLIINGSPCLLVNLTEESQHRIGNILQTFVRVAGDEVAMRLSYFFS